MRLLRGRRSSRATASTLSWRLVVDHRRSRSSRGRNDRPARSGRRCPWRRATRSCGRRGFAPRRRSMSRDGGAVRRIGRLLRSCSGRRPARRRPPGRPCRRSSSARPESPTPRSFSSSVFVPRLPPITKATIDEREPSEDGRLAVLRRSSVRRAPRSSWRAKRSLLEGWGTLHGQDPPSAADAAAMRLTGVARGGRPRAAGRGAARGPRGG